MLFTGDPILIRPVIDRFRTSAPGNTLTYGLQPNAPASMHNRTLTQWCQIFDNWEFDQIKHQRQQHGLPQGIQGYFRDRARALQLYFEIDTYTVADLNWEGLCGFIEKEQHKNSDFVTSRTQINPILDGIRNSYCQQYLATYGHPPP